MAVLFLGKSPQRDAGDDEKASKADDACKAVSDLVRSPGFLAKATPDQRARLQAALNRATFDLAVYRGELLKQQRNQAPLPPVLANTTTMGPIPNPAAALVAIVALCMAAIAAMVVVSTPREQSVASQLERSLNDLRSLAEQIQRSLPAAGATIPLDSSPALPLDAFNLLKSTGILTGAGTAMAVDTSKIEELVTTTVDQVEANVNPQARMRCSDAFIKFRQKTAELRQAMKSGLPAFTILRNLEEWMKAVNELFSCLGLEPPFPV